MQQSVWKIVFISFTMNYLKCISVLYKSPLYQPLQTPCWLTTSVFSRLNIGLNIGLNWTYRPQETLSCTTYLTAGWTSAQSLFLKLLSTSSYKHTHMTYVWESSQNLFLLSNYKASRSQTWTPSTRWMCVTVKRAPFIWRGLLGGLFDVVCLMSGRERGTECLCVCVWERSLSFSLLWIMSCWVSRSSAQGGQTGLNPP